MAMTASVQTGISYAILVLGNNGSAISSTNPVLIPFKSTTLANGAPVWVTQTGSLSLSTFTTSANFGVTNATPFRLWITALYNGGNPLLALINCSNSATIYPLAQHTLVNGVGIVGTSNSGGVFYTSNGTTASTTAFCILGYAEFTAGIATAGNFSVVPNLQLFGPGVKKPGDVVQFVATIESASETTTSFTFVAATSARISITPTSTPNLILITGACCGNSGGTNGSIAATLSRGTVSNTGLFGSICLVGTGASITNGSMSLIGLDKPATTGAQTYAVQFLNTNSQTSLLEETQFLSAQELMG